MSAERFAAIELRRLIRDTAADLAVLTALADEVRALLARPRPLGPEAAAFAAVKLHAWYTGLESVLERIARVVEGSVPGGPAWHQDLLRGMTGALPDVRPAVLAPESLPELAELLAFRHFFRHAYAVALDEARILAHAARLVAVHGRVQADLQAFAAVVQGWIRALEGA